jgi:hypothetical protein
MAESNPLDPDVAPDSLLQWLASPIMTGLSQTHRRLELQCLTNSCTYLGFVTLGTCSRCEDITTQTNQSCQSADTSVTGLSWSPLFNNMPISFMYRWSDVLELNITADGLNLFSYNAPFSVDAYRTMNTSYAAIFGIQNLLTTFLEAK